MTNPLNPNLARQAILGRIREDKAALAKQMGDCNECIPPIRFPFKLNQESGFLISGIGSLLFPLFNSQIMLSKCVAY